MSTPHDELLARLADVDKPFLIVLDEADQIDDPNLLRRLYGIHNVTMILVTNHKRGLFSPLDERLQSRLRSSDTIEFDQYTHDELRGILSDRVAWGLTVGSVTDSQIERIADAASDNARDAISILWSAARHAEQAGCERVHPGDTDDALP